MDELEAVWGPRGRATVDPSTVRAVPPSDVTAPAPAPAPTAVPAALFAAPAVGDADLLPAPSGRTRRPSGVVLAAAAILAIALSIVVGALRVGGGAAPATIPAAPATATTIVSAAADLSGRATTTSTPPTTTPTTVGVTAPPTTVSVLPPPDPRVRPATTGPQPPLADADRVAQRFVEVIAARDCDGLWSLLGRTSQQFLTSPDEPEAPDGRSLLCESLRAERALPRIAVRGPATSRADGSAVVTLESEGEVEELVLVAEDGRWVIDLFGAMADGS